jgi:hypothetical protein
MKDYRTRDERLYDEERAGAAVSHVRDHIDAERLDRKRGECRAAYLKATRCAGATSTLPAIGDRSSPGIARLRLPASTGSAAAACAMSAGPTSIRSSSDHAASLPG